MKHAALSKTSIERPDCYRHGNHRLPFSAGQRVLQQLPSASSQDE
jgi:hypothetical protein